MAMIRSMFSLGVSLALLSGCGTQTQNDAFGLAAAAVGAQLNRAEPEQLTATRASLKARGFDRPLLIATVRNPIELRSGLLQTAVNDGVVFWTGADGSTVKTDAGVLRGTVGITFDLYAADTEGTLSALQDRHGEPYQRTYRHLDGLGKIVVTHYFCEMSAPVPQTIDVFDQSRRTLRFSETCTPDLPDVLGRTTGIENIYWKDVNRLILWRSDQWVSPEVGSLLLERAFE